VLDQPWSRLVDLDLALIWLVAREIGIETPTYRSSMLGIDGKGSERLVKLCQHFGATRYLTGDAAQDYLDADRFRSEGIEVVWHGYQHPIYAQLHGTFIPYLSAIDLLMNIGPGSLSLISNYQTTDSLTS
jgi:hypothetical protein